MLSQCPLVLVPQLAIPAASQKSDSRCSLSASLSVPIQTLQPGVRYTLRAAAKLNSAYRLYSSSPDGFSQLQAQVVSGNAKI